MYSRAYQLEEGKISIPKNYDGNAFREEKGCEPTANEDLCDISTEASERRDNIEECVSLREEASGEAHQKKSSDGGIFASIFKGKRTSSFIDYLPFVKGGRFDVGTEEILLVAISLFLLFSKDGDKECAIMLLLLLFVK